MFHATVPEIEKITRQINTALLEHTTFETDPQSFPVIDYNGRKMHFKRFDTAHTGENVYHGKVTFRMIQVGNIEKYLNDTPNEDATRDHYEPGEQWEEVVELPIISDLFGTVLAQLIPPTLPSVSKHYQDQFAYYRKHRLNQE